MFKKWKEKKDDPQEDKSKPSVSEKPQSNAPSSTKPLNVSSKSKSFDRPIGSKFSKGSSGDSKTANTGQSSVADEGNRQNDKSDTKSGSSTGDASKLSTGTSGSTNVISSKPSSSYSVIVNPRQRGNPILKHVRNVPWEYGEIIPDFVLGKSTCALFLSLRYHQLKPDYIHDRLKTLGHSYDLRVMLVQVDIKDPHHCLKDLAKICILADCTLILAFSIEEAGRYIETYKVYENKPPEAIMEKSDDDFVSKHLLVEHCTENVILKPLWKLQDGPAPPHLQNPIPSQRRIRKVLLCLCSHHNHHYRKLIDCLTTVKSVNKTDCITLMSTFGSVKNIMEASQETLSFCPGIGPQKAKRLHAVFNEPFLKSRKRKSPMKDPTDSPPDSKLAKPTPSTSKEAG